MKNRLNIWLKNDIVLMYTDGYGDQFGGPNNKKFKHSAMEKLLVQNQHWLIRCR